MFPTLELVAAAQFDRERQIRAGALARIVTAARECCKRTLSSRLARLLCGTQVTA